MCGKLIRPSQDVMNPIREAFEALKAPYRRTSSTVTRGSRCGPNPWQQHHHKARDGLQSATKGGKDIYQKFGTDGNMMKSTRNLRSHMIGRTHGSGIWITSHSAMAERKEYVNLIHLRCVDSNKQAGPLWKRPGYQEAQRELANLQKSQGQVQVPYIPGSERKRQSNKLDLLLREYLWAEHFAEPQKLRTPTSIIIFKLVTSRPCFGPLGFQACSVLR